MNESMSLQCPHCHENLKLPVGLAEPGEIVECPVCAKELRAPTQTQKAAAHGQLQNTSDPSALSAPVPIWRFKEGQVSRDKARSRIRRSWIFLSGGCILGILFSLQVAYSPAPHVHANGLSHADVVRNLFLGLTPLLAYMSWGVYWGYVAFWPAFRHNFVAGGMKRRLWNPFTWGGFLFGILMLIPTIALYYGCLGGGIRQHLRHRRIVLAMQEG